jgi:hypothetical protein
MPDAKRSEGARMERKAIRAYLRRELKHTPGSIALSIILNWVLDRQRRYDKKKGGL